MIRIVCLALACALALSACGKKAPLREPPPQNSAAAIGG